ncbi:MAG: GDP-L-fucose synthase [Nanoarchaeota archaeon]
MKTDSKILITGSNGMVGKSLVRALRDKEFTNLLLPSSKDLDLKDQKKVEEFFQINDIEYVFHLAAKVGGIAANISAPAEFLYDNLMMECNIIEISRKFNIKKILFLGSSCIYPKECEQPMKEEYLLSGKLELTNEGYALAKICGLKLCEYYNKQYNTKFISLMPCNIYGPGDHFEPQKSHVISALILKFHEAKIKNLPYVTIWGTGNARREFLYVKDIVEAIIFFFEKETDLPSFVNIGSGKDVSIIELANLIKKIVDYQGEIKLDPSKPDGMPQKLLDINKARGLGWYATTSLKKGLQKTYDWFLKNEKDIIHN